MKALKLDINENIKLILSALCFILFFYMMTSGAYKLPFTYGDDHRIIAMIHPDNMSESYTGKLFDIKPNFIGALQIDAKSGRFRPLSWTWVSLQTYLFGVHVFLYRVINLFIAFLSIIFLYKLLLKLNVSFLVSSVMVALFLYGQNAETWWTLIPPHQNIGDLFFILSLGFFIRHISSEKLFYYHLGLCFITLSALCKESFIAIAPFAIMFHFILSRHLSQKLLINKKKYFISFAVLSIPLAGLVTTIFYSGRIYGYDYPDSILQIIFYNVMVFLKSTALLSAPLVLAVILFYRRLMSRTYWYILLCAFAIVLTQLILLKGIKMNEQHHYLMPMILVSLIITGVSLEYIKREYTGTFYILSGIYTIFILINVKNLIINSNYYAIKNEAYNTMIHTIISSDAKTIIYAGEDSLQNDWLMGAAGIISQYDHHNMIYYFPQSTSLPEYKKKFMHLSGKDFPTISIEKIEQLQNGWILFENPTEKNNRTPPALMCGNNTSLFIQDDKEIKVCGNLFQFQKSYFDLSLTDMIKMDFNKKKQVSFWAIQINKSLCSVSEN